jgi:pimeloyl-ACP methyl ester carboxylesterase
MRAMSLPKALDAEFREIDGRAGALGYYVDGEGAPMLLIHSINAAGSAFEVKPIFDHYRRSRKVYAPDLPGFGRSDRSPRHYDIGLYVSAIHDMLDEVALHSANTDVDALALSLSSEFLARVARDDTTRLRSLAFVSPTGFRRGSEQLRETEGSTREMRSLAAVVNIPVLRKALFALLVQPWSIRYFLRRTWGSDAIDEQLAHYDDLTTHQPGAENAPLAFLSGRLFAADIRNVYEALEQPVWLAHNSRGDFSDFGEAEWTRQRGNWQLTAFDTGALPHFEKPAEFFPAYDAFLEGLPRS